MEEICIPLNIFKARFSNLMVNEGCQKNTIFQQNITNVYLNGAAWKSCLYLLEDLPPTCRKGNTNRI